MHDSTPKPNAHPNRELSFPLITTSGTLILGYSFALPPPEFFPLQILRLFIFPHCTRHRSEPQLPLLDGFVHPGLVVGG